MTEPIEVQVPKLGPKDYDLTALHSITRADGSPGIDLVAIEKRAVQDPTLYAALRASLKHYGGCPECQWQARPWCTRCPSWMQAFGVTRQPTLGQLWRERATGTELLVAHVIYAGSGYEPGVMLSKSRTRDYEHETFVPILALHRGWIHLSGP